MGSPKSLTLSMSVDRASKRHTCQHSKKHVIAKGDLRLKVKVGRGYDHYCLQCARKFLSLSIESLQKLEAELEAQAEAQG
jgi:hypothetical protein